MTKDNADIDYDPELPFAYLDNGNIQLYARFKHRSDAEVFRDRCNFGNIVDTTPKPKIPDGAEFITWLMNGANEVAIYVNFNPLKPWEWAGMYYSEENLLVEIGDAEVTVLVRKDET